MKCIKQIATDKIIRTNDKAAVLMVSSGDWKYISKEEWKEKVRDNQLINKETENGKRQKDLPFTQH